MKRLLFYTVTILFALASTPAHAKKEVKYTLAVLHYNLQYVAGDTGIENKIILQGLDPVLDFYLAHPNWGADIEMQGYMVEETAKRYPEIFGKLKILVNRGQLELVSFHYSDQLFLAYPRLDAEWSDRINKRVFEKLGIKQSGTVFTQEGQFGEGMAKFMADSGFKALVLPKNLFRYAHGEKDAAPYYALNGVDVVIGAKGLNYDDGAVSVQAAWTYMDDAELLPTGRTTPYSQYYKYKPEEMEKYGVELESLEKQGFHVGTISQYLADVKAAGVKPATLEPMIDGTWQPADTDNLFRWMGDHLAQYERDNDILTGNVRVRHKLAALEVVIKQLSAAGRDTSALYEKLFEAWRLQSLAEVSDSTGWTPQPIEIKYSLENSAAAEKITGEIAAEVKKMMGADTIIVDIASGKVEVASAPPAEPDYPEVDCPLKYELKGEIEKEKHNCFKIDGAITRLDLQFKTGAWLHNYLQLVFPRTVDYILYSPSLWEDSYVKYPMTAFAPEKGSFTIPASNGLIAIGADTFIIKKTDTVHSTYRFDFAAPTVAIELRKPPSKVYKWTIYIFRGTPEDAVRFANSINVFPKVVF
jgi:hypothetical protein